MPHDDTRRILAHLARPRPFLEEALAAKNVEVIDFLRSARLGFNLALPCVVWPACSSHDEKKHRVAVVAHAGGSVLRHCVPCSVWSGAAAPDGPWMTSQWLSHVDSVGHSPARPKLSSCRVLSSGPWPCLGRNPIDMLRIGSMQAVYWFM